MFSILQPICRLTGLQENGEKNEKEWLKEYLLLRYVGEELVAVNWEKHDFLNTLYMCIFSLQIELRGSWTDQLRADVEGEEEGHIRGKPHGKHHGWRDGLMKKLMDEFIYP